MSQKLEKPTRINKFLAQKGLASRRAVDQWIRDRRLAVDGKTISELGFKLEKYTEISLDGVPLEIEHQSPETFAFYKPPSVVSTMIDPEKRSCLGDFFAGSDSRLFPIGRLDYDAEGLILLTNDGDLAHRLAHPRFGKSKTYEVKLKGLPTNEAFKLMRNGIRLEDGPAKPLHLKLLRKTRANCWVEMSLNEGRNHQIKRMWDYFGIQVLKIKRIQFGPIRLERLKPAQFRKITGMEAKKLLQGKKG